VPLLLDLIKSGLGRRNRSLFVCLPVCLWCRCGSPSSQRASSCGSPQQPAHKRVSDDTGCVALPSCSSTSSAVIEHFSSVQLACARGTYVCGPSSSLPKAPSPVLLSVLHCKDTGTASLGQPTSPSALAFSISFTFPTNYYFPLHTGIAPCRLLLQYDL